MIRDCKHGQLARSCNICDLEETIRCQQIVLDQIAQALGLEPGDVDGIGAAIEGLKRDADRERIKLDGVHEFREYVLDNHRKLASDPSVIALLNGFLIGYLAERGIKLGMKEALAAGEAGK